MKIQALDKIDENKTTQHRFATLCATTRRQLKKSWEQRQNMSRKELSEVSTQESEREKTKWLKHLTNEKRV